MNPRSLRLLARRIRETSSGMVHNRSREISEKMANDLEKKAAELEQRDRGDGAPADTPRDEC